MHKVNLRNLQVGVVGHSYVGLPLAEKGGTRRQVISSDIKLYLTDEVDGRI